jgi:hypothetical protein
MFSDYFLFRIGDVTIMQKGKADVISDGQIGILENFFPANSERLCAETGISAMNLGSRCNQTQEVSQFQ